MSSNNEKTRWGGKYIEHEDGTGTFNLNIAFDYTPVEGEVEYIELMFDIVSLILQRATYGQHRLGQITVVDKASKDKDILITKDKTDAYNSRIWYDGKHVFFSRNHIYSPGLMLHELGHYLYDLGDEYKGCREKRWDERKINRLKAELDELQKEGNISAIKVKEEEQMREKNRQLGLQQEEKRIGFSSIMEYSFGFNTRFKRKLNKETGNSEKREYKVLGGFDEFWKDIGFAFVDDDKVTKLKYGEGNLNLELIYEKEKVVTDFCCDTRNIFLHNAQSDSEHNQHHPRRDQLDLGDKKVQQGKSCWTVIHDNYGKYGLVVPFDQNFEEFLIKRESIDKELEKLANLFKDPESTEMAGIKDEKSF